MDKKATSLDALYPAVLTILLVGICLGVGAFILDQTGDAISATTYTVVNETTAAAVTETGTRVPYATDCGFHDMAITEIYSSNGSLLIAAANYTTVNADGGYIYYTGKVAPFINNTVWNVSFTYVGTKDTASTDACGAMSATGTGIGSLAGWIAVIVVVLAAAVVLGLVINSFGSKNTAV